MEKYMNEIYREEYPCGSYTVYGNYLGKGDLHLSEFHYGSDVEDFWGNDEYEYYFTILEKGLPEFFLACLTKGFNYKEKFTIESLKAMCDVLKIEYRTNVWV
tara:strand:+ start:169 stop:474 length:306 start_codon:yes stop_codon:yes gene_type:complete